MKRERIETAVSAESGRAVIVQLSATSVMLRVALRRPAARIVRREAGSERATSSCAQRGIASSRSRSLKRSADWLMKAERQSSIEPRSRFVPGRHRSFSEIERAQFTTEYYSVCG